MRRLTTFCLLIFVPLLSLAGTSVLAQSPALTPAEPTTGDAEEFQLESGFVSLFNGEDLTGWCFRPMPGGKTPTTAENTEVFDGKKKSSNDRYVARDGHLVVTAPPEGRRIEQMWTTEQFDGDFVLKLEFRASPNADSGVFILQPQLQCRDYPLAGPYKDLKKYRSGDWNELEVTVTDGVAHATCNGELLEAAMKVPASGPIGLEGDRGQMEYRRIRLKRM